MRAAVKSEGWKTVRVFVVAGLIPLGGLLACALVALLGVLVFSILAGEPTPERPFTALDFFPAEDALPDDYRIAQAPQPAGPGTSLGIGDDDDAYAVYAPRHSPYGWVHLIIFRENYSNFVDHEYDYWMIFRRDEFEPKQVAFKSERAQRYSIGCARESGIDGRGAIGWRCTYLARYDEFTVNLIAVAGPEHLSWSEFQTLIEAIDARAVQLLGPIEAAP